jgi:hypothetical protein
MSTTRLFGCDHPVQSASLVLALEQMDWAAAARLHACGPVYRDDAVVRLSLEVAAR